MGWRKVADAVHEHGGHLFIQLMHVGRISHPDNDPATLYTGAANGYTDYPPLSHA